MAIVSIVMAAGLFGLTGCMSDRNDVWIDGSAGGDSGTAAQASGSAGGRASKSAAAGGEPAADAGGKMGEALPGARDTFSQSPSAATDIPYRIQINGMRLSDAVGLAIARNPDISRANAVIAQSQSEVAIAKSAWYPTLEYGVQPGYGNSLGRNNRSASGAIGTVGANQLVYDFGRTSGQISGADASLNRNRYLLSDTIETVAFNTAATFVDFASSQDVMAAAQRQVEALRETRAKIDERVRAGLSDASDLNQADVAVQRAEAEALKARTKIDVAAGKLSELIGVRPLRVASLSATNGFVDRLKGGRGGPDIDNTPAVQSASAAVDAAGAKVAVAKASRFPSIGVGVSHSRSSGRSDATGIDNSKNTWVGVNIQGNVSLGGLAKHQIAAAEAERNAASQALENQRMLTRTAVNSSETEASGAGARLTSYEKVTQLFRNSRELYWQEYTLNKRPLTEVINAEREVFAADVERISAIADRVLAKIRAQASVGKFVTLLRAADGKRS